MSFKDRFGGSQLQSASVAYRAAVLVDSQALSWPERARDEAVLPRLMEASALSPNLAFLLPDATEGSLGSDCLFRNLGEYAFTIQNAMGVAVTTVAPGQAVNVYLRNKDTPAGVWGVILLGVGVGQLDLLSAAGNGLVVMGARLAVSPTTSLVGGDTGIGDGDRAKLLVWVGGAGNFYLPTALSVGPFSTEIRNQGSGVLTISTTPPETIDGSNSIILQVGESCVLHSAHANERWYTVGRSRPASFAFTQLQKTVTGGTVELTVSEASNVVQTYTGALTANVDIVLPSVVQVYYVSNQTTGPFTLRVKNGGNGALVPLPTGQSAVLFSDGTNVINAATTVAGLSALVLAAGSQTTPSLGVGSTTSGFYSPGADQVGIAAAGATVGIFYKQGLVIAPPSGFAEVGIRSANSDAALQLAGPQFSSRNISFYTGTNQRRWRLETTGEAENGADNGSNFRLISTGDNQAQERQVFLINRRTGEFNIPYLRSNNAKDSALVGQVAQFAASPAFVPANWIMANGAILSRAAYPELWAYAQYCQLIASSDADWFTYQAYGWFTPGDGANTFRIPDLRGVFMRSLDQNRGVDPGRPSGYLQQAAVQRHGHGLGQTPHTHGADTGGVGDHVHPIIDNGHDHPFGVAQGGGVSYAGGGGQAAPNYRTAGAVGTGIGMSGAGAHSHPVNVYGQNANVILYDEGVADGRPINNAYPTYIRYQ